MELHHCLRIFSPLYNNYLYDTPLVAPTLPIGATSPRNGESFGCLRQQHYGTLWLFLPLRHGLWGPKTPEPKWRLYLGFHQNLRLIPRWSFVMQLSRTSHDIGFCHQAPIPLTYTTRNGRGGGDRTLKLNLERVVALAYFAYAPIKWYAERESNSYIQLGRLAF